MCEDAAHQLLIEIAGVGNRDTFLDVNKINEALGKVAHRHDEIGNAGCDRVARHRRIFGFCWLLYEDDAARFFYRTHADGAVCPGPAQNNGKAVRSEEHTSELQSPMYLV